MNKYKNNMKSREQLHDKNIKKWNNIEHTMKTK